MRVSHARLVAAVWGASLAAGAFSSPAEIDMTDADRKQPPPPPPPPPNVNLPGETNRQFAARMKSEPSR